MAVSLRYRQIHLDFHTSEHCTTLGAQFDADAFAATLAEAHVDHINIFAKCHHGYSYYPTKAGTIHPGLSFDLLGQQIEALHKRDIRCPIYYTILWDELAAREHPEWICVDKTGRLVGRTPLGNEWGWYSLDVSSGYLDYILAAVDELMAGYDVDGFFFDICFPMANYSPWGMAQMVSAGVNPEDDQAAWDFARRKQTDFMRIVTEHVQQRRPAASIFYNSSLYSDMQRVQPYMTHLEVESLPTTGGWGYLHYPITARQARTYGKEFLGMTGRFHMSWGDFGGLKTRDQLDYEVGTILAAGGKVCVGDQLNPNGKLDPAVYRLIGHSYARIEALEPWLNDAQPSAEIGILATGAVEGGSVGIASYSHETEGAAQFCSELGYQFDGLDPTADFSRYGALIIPDGTTLDPAFTSALEAYLASGGKLIASGALALDALPVSAVEPTPTVPSYLRPDAAMLSHLTATELADDYDYAFYGQSYRVQPRDGATVYGEIRTALFSRTWAHFMGHHNAPASETVVGPLAVVSGNVLYLAAPLFSGYRRDDYWAYRAMLQALLVDFLPPRLLTPSGPGWSEFSHLTQAASGERPRRDIVHVVAYHPRRTMQPIPHVDQSALTAGLGFALRREAAPTRVYLAPDETPIGFSYADGIVQVSLPPIGAHAVVVLE